MLREVSPIFEKMFSGKISDAKPSRQRLTDISADELPPPPTQLTCADGSRILLFRMPQLELNKESSLTILLHAAHMHNDRVPREISFERFVALAEVCLRYRCTSPLELYVEHRWLPQWVHKAVDDMPDGLVTISFAFGLRRLFTRVTKTAILNLVDEEELASKPWQPKIKEKIWAVRCAKMAQVYGTCSRAVEEYLRPPGQEAGSEGDGETSDSRRLQPGNTIMSPTLVSPNFLNSPASPVPGPMSFTNVPRCPKGNHWCDAVNLGWLMLVLNELQLLPTIVNPSILAKFPSKPPSRSLGHIVEAIRSVSNPPNNVHYPGRTSVCDPAPVLRAAINDVYNSVSGLTLFDIDGTRHGWAMSRDQEDEPQTMLRPGSEYSEISLLEQLQLPSPSYSTPSQDYDTSQTSAATEALSNEAICLRILQSLDSYESLQIASRLNRSFYQVYRKNELALMRQVVRASRVKTMQQLSGRAQDASEEILSPRVADHLRDLQERRSREQGDGEGSSRGHSFLDLEEVETYDSPPSGQNPYFKMTEEEARRVLWPEPSPPLSPPQTESQVSIYDDQDGVDAGKYAANEIVRVEDKTLVVIGNKQLRQDLDRKLGLPV
jgi:hypothetical protein